MKTYGLKRREIHDEDYLTSHWISGAQSRKVARRRAKDKKDLHRRGRRTAKHALRVSQMNSAEKDER
jgi:hypothetical protein